MTMQELQLSEILNRMRKTNFSGTLKAYTLEEEIDCHRFRAFDQDLIEDVKVAIVIDRRGKQNSTSYL